MYLPTLYLRLRIISLRWTTAGFSFSGTVNELVLERTAIGCRCNVSSC